MRISYDSVSSEYLYPLSRRDVARIAEHIPQEIWGAIRRIRFGCSRKSPLEGRTLKRGTSYDIRVNFCVRRVGKDLESLLLSERSRYVEEIEKYGGTPDLTRKTVAWDLKGAKRYAYYVILHEIAHVAYALTFPQSSMSPWRSVPGEEDWCDNYSAHLTQKIDS